MHLTERIKFAIWIIAALQAIPAVACKYNVRDVGFVDWNPQPYKLYACLAPDTPTQLATTLNNTAAALFLESNVEFESVDLKSNPDHNASLLARKQNVSELPSLLLVSPDQDALPLPLPSKSGDLREIAWNSLEAVVSSPMREALFKRIIQAYAVVLIVEGTSAEQNQQARASAAQAIKRIGRLMEKLPKTVKSPPEIMVIPKNKNEAEKVLLWSLALPSGKDDTHVAVMYGRGRKMGPTLSGSISENEVYQALAILGQDCECSLDRAWMTGPMIPASWGSELQALVHEHAGFDAENPLVKTEISRIMARGPSSAIRPVGLPDLPEFSVDTLGYEEISVDGIEETPEPAAPGATPIAQTNAAPAAPVPEPEAALVPPGMVGGLDTALITLGCIVVVVALACLFIFWRPGRSS